MARFSLTHLLLGGLMLAAPLAGVAHAEDPDKAQVQKEIWAKELAIYSGRGKGDLGPYINNIAPDFAAWPPGTSVPTDATALKQGGAQMGSHAGDAKERLEMTFTDFRKHGDTAVIYYKTHMTVRADGTPVDNYYEVTHTWTRVDGKWLLIGGMARDRPNRPAGH